MAQVSSNEWQSTLTCKNNEQLIELKSLIGDQTWQLGANFKLSVSSGSATLYPWFSKTEGTFKTFSKLYSPQLNNNRDVIVYLPPSYTENTLKVY